jgi:poly(3-hydroxybutyrate) depolymerase
MALLVLAACTTPEDSGDGNGAAGTLGQAGLAGAGVAGVSAGVAGVSAGAAGANAGAAGVSAGAAGVSAGAAGVNAGTAGATAGTAGVGGGAGTAGKAGMAGAPAEEPCEKDLEPMAGQDDCTAPLKPGDDRLCELSYNGSTRRYYVYAPPTFNACKPAALVVDCHGASESIEVHVGKEGFRADSPLGYGSSWRRAVQGDNVVVVTPEGVSLRWSQASDAAFLNTVTDRVEMIADIDPEKVYLSGISMGGMITAETACEDAERWRGMVPVAMLTNTCPSLSRPMPAMIFHAETDSITSYAGSRSLAESMAELNNCQNGPIADAMVFGGASSSPDPVCFEMPPGAGSPSAADPYATPLVACPSDRPVSTCTKWDQCDEGVEVVFCTVEAADQIYGGHLLYTNDTGLNLPALAWPFLKKFWK